MLNIVDISKNMNKPIFKISGKTRRLLKKELSLLKFKLKMFWFYEDIDRVYGGGKSDKEIQNIFEKDNNKINELTILLNEKI